MHPRSFSAIITPFSNNALAVSVGVEIDSARRDDADEIGAEAFEEGAVTFDAWDGEEDLECFADVQCGGAGEGEGV